MNRRVELIIAGTVKGGTTSLDAYLRSHPQIGMSKIKEARFFDNDDHFKNGEPSYQQYHQMFADVWLRKLLGETTPNYMYVPAALQRIHAYNPAIKIIVILRNPVDRAYSHWNMQRQLDKETRGFSEAIRQELAQGIQIPSGSGGSNYIRRGLYTEQLERIWKFFQRERTMILKNEDLRKNHFDTLNNVYRFLGVGQQKYIPLKEWNVRSYEKPIDVKDRELLKEVFRPEIKKLEQTLNWDCSNWLAD